MDKEDLFINYVYMSNILKIKEYLEDKTFNPNFENNYSFRLALKENNRKVVSVFLQYEKITNSVNSEWINLFIKDSKEKNIIHFIQNIKNF
jgi:hypothetical protein